jgi:hypothetical protein
MSDLPQRSAKQSAVELMELLPDDVTRDELIYRLRVRQKIEAALADAEAGNLISTDELRRRLRSH